MAQTTLEAALAKYEATRPNRARAYTAALSEVRNAAAASGSYRSGAMLQSMAAIAEDELWSRASILWSEIVSAHRNRNEPIDTDNSPTKFREAIDAQVHKEYGELMKEYEAMTKMTGYPPVGQPNAIVAGLVGKVNTLRSLYAIEVPEYFVKLQNARDKASAGGNSYHFAGPTQFSTGDHATNTMVIDQSRRETATAAITELIAYLKSQQDDKIAQRMDALEAAVSARNELAQPQPNKTKLMDWFNVLTGTLQAYGSVPQVQATLASLTAMLS